MMNGSSTDPTDNPCSFLKNCTVLILSENNCMLVIGTKPVTLFPKEDLNEAAAQRTKKQNQLKETQAMFQQRIQQREKDLKQLREAVESHKLSAQTAVEDSERIFTEHIRSIERRCSEAKQQIREHEKASVSQAEGLVGGLEQEINDLRRRHAELEQLLQTKDHIYLLKSFQCLSALPECTDIPNIPPSSVFSFDSMRESLHQLRDKLEDFFKEELKKIPDKVTFTNMVPRTRNDFLQYYLQLTLDPNTAHKRLHLSNRNRVITIACTEHSGWRLSADGSTLLTPPVRLDFSRTSMLKRPSRRVRAIPFAVGCAFAVSQQWADTLVESSFPSGT
ncbi:hypothetical protein Q8A67_007305 [Cirrhinus molitorella]|uniref:TRIM8/14/16/25/29/45/65 coiled-coil region domain-containing protein n=1 Tax=Cirrhinus molitorella TaxID=172907 RepID=A0AA88QAL0_9TELE|nr:hypothetical protein Q8A67_007305 [Cirrhinus molitorella]